MVQASVQDHSACWRKSGTPGRISWLLDQLSWRRMGSTLVERQHWALAGECSWGLGYRAFCHPCSVSSRPTPTFLAAGCFPSINWVMVTHLPIFAQTNLPVFCHSSGSNVPMATFFSVLGSCHKLFDMFSYKIVRLVCRSCISKR